MRRLTSTLALLLGFGVLLSSPAFAADAQAPGNPSTKQIIMKLRGIRAADPGNETTADSPAQPGDPSTAAAAPGVSTQAVAQPQEASINLTVHFAFGSAELTPDARETLDHLGQALQSDELKPFAFRVAGHTDAVGTEEANKELSQQRADAVKEYLVNQFGIKPSHLEAVGFGKSQLIDPNNPSSGRNRRVQVVNLGEAKE